MNFDLIIFDCDGVLVDSEVISCRAHAETLTRHGYPITAEQVFDRFLGRSMRQAALEVEAELGRRLPDDFSSQTYAEIFRLFAESLEATPHIGEALDRQRRGGQNCLATHRPGRLHEVLDGRGGGCQQVAERLDRKCLRRRQGARKREGPLGRELGLNDAAHAAVS